MLTTRALIQRLVVAPVSGTFKVLYWSFGEAPTGDAVEEHWKEDRNDAASFSLDEADAFVSEFRRLGERHVHAVVIGAAEKIERSEHRARPRVSSTEAFAMMERQHLA